MNPILSAGDPLWAYVGARAWKPMPEAEEASGVAGQHPGLTGGEVEADRAETA